MHIRASYTIKRKQSWVGSRAQWAPKSSLSNYVVDKNGLDNRFHQPPPFSPHHQPTWRHPHVPATIEWTWVARSPFSPNEVTGDCEREQRGAENGEITVSCDMIYAEKWVPLDCQRHFAALWNRVERESPRPYACPSRTQSWRTGIGKRMCVCAAPAVSFSRVVHCSGGGGNLRDIFLSLCLYPTQPRERREVFLYNKLLVIV